MITELLSHQTTYSDWLLLLGAALLIGIAKAGISGAGLMAVPVLAIAYGGKSSSGLLLPLLIVADVFAVAYYHRHANWQHLLRLFPWALFGILTGTWLGGEINDEAFRLIMGVIILLSLGIMIWQQQKPDFQAPVGWWFSATLGILSGVTTMVGNLAGAVATLYLLSMQLPKNAFIGTAAWFFLVVNLFKVPFHLIVWETITLSSLYLDLVAIPAVFVGIVLGIIVVKRLPEPLYRRVIIFSTAVAALLMVL